MSKVGFLIAAVMLLCMDGLLLAQTTNSRYRIANSIHVEGDGGWDYITADDSTGRLFVSHGSMVQVIDAKKGITIGTIPGTNGVHGIALARDVNKGFTSDGRDTTVTVFDGTTLKVLGKIRVTGINPDAIVYDAFSHSVLTFNGKSSNATVIDAKTDKVIATIPLDGKPEFPASDGHGSLYVNIEDKNVVEVIDTKTMKIERKFSISPGEGPSGLVLDAAADRLFVGCGNKLLVVADAKAGKVLTSLPIGEHVDAVAFDPLYKRAYASCGDGTLTVVQAGNDGSFNVLETVATQKGARTVALDKKSHHLYLPTAEFGPAPPPTAANPKPRPSVLPGTFVVLDVETMK